MSVQIYHNPHCSKSRASLALLEEKVAADDIEIIPYLDTPPTAETLLKLCHQLNCHPIKLMRTQEARFEELGLNNDDERSDLAWCQLMADNPILIQRPIVIRDNHVVIGRPPENVLDLL